MRWTGANECQGLRGRRWKTTVQPLTIRCEPPSGSPLVVWPKQNEQEIHGYDRETCGD
jgi:hypothetical protein